MALYWLTLHKPSCFDTAILVRPDTPDDEKPEARRDRKGVAFVDAQFERAVAHFNVKTLIKGLLRTNVAR